MYYPITKRKEEQQPGLRASVGDTGRLMPTPAPPTTNVPPTNTNLPPVTPPSAPNFDSGSSAGFGFQPHPGVANTTGKFGTYTPGRNWDSSLSQIGSMINKDPEAGHRPNDLQAGFDASYLQKLAASQIDPLKEAYQEAIRTAGADFNRMGMAGSGFEVGDKFGSQPGSLSTRFLQEAGNVSRDVALRGAEAEREDLFRKHALDEDSRQYWINFDVNRQQLNRDNLARMVDMGSRLDQQNEANQQWYSNLHENQFQNYQNNLRDQWRDVTGLSQWDVGRRDANEQFRVSNEMERFKVEQEARQQAMNNMMNLLAQQNQSAWQASLAHNANTPEAQARAQQDQANWDRLYGMINQALSGIKW